jgi:hypothetical protein
VFQDLLAVAEVLDLQVEAVLGHQVEAVLDHQEEEADNFIKTLKIYLI